MRPGRYLSEGYVAVDPDIIPYGSKLYIMTKDGSWDYGYAIAADTGGAMLSGRVLVDQYMILMTAAVSMACARWMFMFWKIWTSTMKLNDISPINISRKAGI